jgi:cell division protein FtsB
MPWASISVFIGWLGKGLAAIFSFVKTNTSADYQSVNQMQKDINTELREDIKILKAEIVSNRTACDEALATHKAAAEEAERKCNRRISSLVKTNAVLQAKVKQLMEERDEMIAIRVERDKPEFQARSIAHTTGIVKEEARVTKVEASDEDTGS